MSTYSPNLKFELIGTGEQSGTWGNTTNINIGTAIEQAIVGMATLDSGDFTANTATLLLTNSSALQDARALCLNIAAGAVSAAGTVNVPAIEKPYIIINGSSFTVTVKVSGQPGVAVPAGKRTVVYNNGTDVGAQINWLAALEVAGNVAVGGTLGVTGVATLGNGAILGTPASGVVTNLTGTASININGTVGATTASTGAFTTLTTSSTVTHNGGTANGVAFLNGSKVLTTGSALTFDGSRIALATATSNIQLTTTVNTNQAFISLADADGRTAVFRGPNSGAPNCAQIGTTTNHDTAFLFGNAEQMRLTSTGLGIGTSSPSYKLQVSGASGVSAAIDMSGGIVLGTEFSSLKFTASAVGFIGAEIRGINTNGGTNLGVMAFHTAGTEKMRLDSSGNLLVGVTSVLSLSKVSISYNSISQRGMTLLASATGLTDQIAFSNPNGIVGSISSNGSVTTYNVTSDYRLKTVIGPVADAGQRIDALQPVEYTWNVNGERTRGFLAHQFQEVYAGSVSGTKDAVDAEGKPVYQAMQASTSEVIADLVAMLQEHRAEIASLKTRLAAAGI